MNDGILPAIERRLRVQIVAASETESIPAALLMTVVGQVEPGAILWIGGNVKALARVALPGKALTNRDHHKPIVYIGGDASRCGKLTAACRAQHLFRAGALRDEVHRGQPVIVAVAGIPDTIMKLYSIPARCCCVTRPGPGVGAVDAGLAVRSATSASMPAYRCRRVYSNGAATISGMDGVVLTT